MGERSHNYSEKMGAVGWSLAVAGTVGLAVGVFNVSDTPLESGFKAVAGPIVDAVPYMDNPFEKDVHIPLSDGGKLTMGEYYGQFVTYTNVDVERINKLFGATTDSLKVERDGYLVNRWNIPGYSELYKIPQADGGVYVTRVVNGIDAGIDVSHARFELLRPDTAEEVGGELRCDSSIGDIEFTGCIPGVDTDDNVLSRIPIFGANSDWAAEDIANNVFNEYAKVDDPCFWDNWIIPALNESYARHDTAYRIDGPAQYDQAAKTLLRYFIRSRLSPGVNPSDIAINLTGEYRPLLPLNQRVGFVLESMGVADNITDLDEESGFSFCTESSDDFNGDAVQPFGFSSTISWDRIAIGGMERVPDGYILHTNSYDLEGGK